MRKVLIVDDEPSYRDSLALILSHEQYEVRTAVDGRTAFAMLDDFMPDVLLVDWMLRDKMNGIEVAESLVAINPKLQTIVITGYPTAALAAQVAEIPAAQMLIKPFGFDRLLAAMNRGRNDAE
jgi:DNA-binding NtrC family response regulator